MGQFSYPHDKKGRDPRYRGQIVDDRLRNAHTKEGENNFNYSIKRTVHGQEMTFKLTNEELCAAIKTFNKKLFYEQIVKACQADEIISSYITEDANDNWESGEFASQYDCIVAALNKALDYGEIDKYEI